VGKRTERPSGAGEAARSREAARREQLRETGARTEPRAVAPPEIDGRRRAGAQNAGSGTRAHG
jgi:hypothetical protein